MARFGFPLFLMLLTTVYLAAASQIRVQFSEGLVGPKFLPFLAAGLTYLALLHILWREFRAPAGEKTMGRSLLRPAAVIVITVAYVGVFGAFGYAVSTFLFALALFRVFEFERGRPLVMVLYAAAVTFVFFLLFAVAFGIRLPVLPGIY